MYRGLIFSVVFHAGLLAWALISIHNTEPPKPPVLEPVAVSLVEAAGGDVWEVVTHTDAVLARLAEAHVPPDLQQAVAAARAAIDQALARLADQAGTFDSSLPQMVESARGKMDILGVIASGTLGAMLGNYFWYLVARVIGIERFKPLIEKYGRWLTFDWAEIEKAEKLFGSQGWAIVFFGRMLPTLRSLISIPAGLLHMRLSTFVIWSTIGTAGWTTLLGLSGWAFGRRYESVDTVVGPLSTAILVVIAAGYIWRLIRWKRA
mgnify:CR=1 FL=1